MEGIKERKAKDIEIRDLFLLNPGYRVKDCLHKQRKEEHRRAFTRNVPDQASDIPCSIWRAEQYGGATAGLEARTKINRKDFNLSYGAVIEAGNVALGEIVTIEIDLEATPKVEKTQEVGAAE